MARAVLSFKKFVDRGDKKITLTAFTGVRPHHDLPAEYLRHEKHFLRGTPQGHQMGTLFFFGFKSQYLPTSEADGLVASYITQGDTLDGAVLGPLIDYVRECGKDLGSILSRQARDNAGWEGDLELLV